MILHSAQIDNSCIHSEFCLAPHLDELWVREDHVGSGEPLAAVDKNIGASDEGGGGTGEIYSSIADIIDMAKSANWHQLLEWICLRSTIFLFFFEGLISLLFVIQVGECES